MSRTLMMLMLMSVSLGCMTNRSDGLVARCDGPSFAAGYVPRRCYVAGDCDGWLRDEFYQQCAKRIGAFSSCETGERVRLLPGELQIYVKERRKDSHSWSLYLGFATCYIFPPFVATEHRYCITVQDWRGRVGQYEFSEIVRHYGGILATLMKQRDDQKIRPVEADVFGHLAESLQTDGFYDLGGSGSEGNLDEDKTGRALESLLEQGVITGDEYRHATKVEKQK